MGKTYNVIFVCTPVKFFSSKLKSLTFSQGLILHLTGLCSFHMRGRTSGSLSHNFKIQRDLADRDDALADLRSSFCKAKNSPDVGIFCVDFCSQIACRTHRLCDAGLLNVTIYYFTETYNLVEKEPCLVHILPSVRVEDAMFGFDFKNIQPK